MNGCDRERFIRGIGQRVAQFVDGGIDVGVVVYMRIGGPEPGAQLFAGDDFTRFFEEGPEYLINLSLELWTRPLPGHFLPPLVPSAMPQIDRTTRGDGYPPP